jgi:uncharacterized membrane protein
MSFLIWNFIHIASVVLFLGNITTGLFWAAHANKSRDFKLLASTFDGIIKSDRWFTVPGVVGIVISGIASAIKGGFPILGTGWIFWSIVLFSVSGFAFGFRVAPLQHRILHLARSANDSEEGWSEFQQTFRNWELWGLFSLITPIAAMIIMVLKPALPGL